MEWKSEAAKDRIIVALDCSGDEAVVLGEKLAGHARWVKIGMTLYYAVGPSIVNTMHKLGFKVFLDLKLHDIPHQVYGAASSIAQAWCRPLHRACEWRRAHARVCRARRAQGCRRCRP